MNQFLSQIIDSFPGMVFIKNTNGVYIACSDDFAKFVGYNSSFEVTGKTTFDIIPNSSAQWAVKLDNTLIDTQRQVSDIYPFKFENDSYTHWRRVTRKPLYDNQNNLIGIIGVLEDVGDVMALTDELASAKARFTALSETMEYNSFVILLWKTDSLDIDYITDNIDYLGIKNGSISHLEDWAGYVHPDDSADFWEKRKPLLEQSSNVDFWHEYRIKNNGGEVRWVNERLSFINIPGMSLYRSIIIDTTARHENANMDIHAKFSGNVSIGDIHLLDIVSRDFLQNFCDTVSESLGFPSYILDAAGIPLTNKSGLCEFCDLVNKSKKGASLCKISNANLCIAVRNAGSMIVNSCETIGLCSAAFPIVVSGKMLGIWSAGRINAADSISTDNIKSLASSLSIDIEEAVIAFNTVKTCTKDELDELLKKLQPYVNDLSDYIYRSFLLMYEAERIVKSREIVSKSFKTDRLQRSLYETLYGFNYGEKHHLNNAFSLINDFFGFNRALIICPRGRRLETYYNWHEKGRVEFLEEHLSYDAMNPFYRHCTGSTEVKLLNIDCLPEIWNLKDLEISSCYYYSVDFNNKNVGVIYLFQSEERPLLDEDETDTLNTVLKTFGSYLITKQLERLSAETSHSMQLIINNLNEIIYVVDKETYEVVFSNSGFDGMDIIGARGVPCYLLQNKDKPCSCCGLEMMKDKPMGYSYTFETNERKKGYWFSVTQTLVMWHNGRPSYIIRARDITEDKYNS